MASLPDASSLQRRQAPSETPNIRVGSLDYGPQAAGAVAIGRGLNSVATAAQDFGRAQAEIDDFATRKRVLDLELQTEMALEERKRAMPLGGNGYADGFLSDFQKQAAAFVGKEDANIPASQRAAVGLRLKAMETKLYERAQRDEWAERDRHEIDGLEKTLGTTKSMVEANPQRRDEMLEEGRKLIETSRIQPAAKHRLLDKYGKEIDKTAALTRIMQARTKDEFDALAQDLAPHAPEKGSPHSLTRGYVDQIKKFEGFTPKSSWDYKQHSIGYGTKGKPGEVIDEAEAQRRLDQELAAAAQVVDRFAPGLDAGTRAALTSLTFNSGSAWTSAGLGQAIKAGDLATAKQRFLQYNQAGGEVLPGLVERRRAEASWIGTGGPVEQTASAPEGGYYAGPFSNLPLSERKALWAQAEGQREKLKGEITKEITAYEGNAAQGYLPPDEILTAIKRRVEAVNDPLVTAQFNSTFQHAAISRDLQKLPPQVIEDLVNRERVRASESGQTPEQQKRLDHVTKLAENVRKSVNADPLTHAHKVGLEVMVPSPQGEPAAGSVRAAQEVGIPSSGYVQPVKLEKLDFAAPDIGARLERRAETARLVGQHYSQPPQFFTATERDALKDAFNKGGPALTNTLGMIYRAFGNDSLAAIKEVALKDAPEAAIIGKMMVDGASKAAISDAAQGLMIKRQEGFISHVDVKLRNPEVETASKALSLTSAAIDPVIRTADAIYETRHRVQQKREFDPKLYRQIIAEVMGETEINGRKFGGVGKQGASFGDGKWSTPVVVPIGVAQDGFDQMVAAIKPGDLAVIGVPLDGGGRPLTVADVRRATWHSVGNGRYWLQTGTNAAGDPQFAIDRNGRTFLMDVNPVLSDIRQRVPEIFAGYQPQPRTSYDTRLPVPDQRNEQTGIAPGDTRINRQFGGRASGFQDDPARRTPDMTKAGSLLPDNPTAQEMDNRPRRRTMPTTLRED